MKVSLVFNKMLYKLINKFINSMKKFEIDIPKGVRFLSDWGEFNFSQFPLKCIINKQIPGCGFTEYCINGPENVILCSPRKLLLKNKWNQHQKEVYLVRNEMDKDPDTDKDLSKETKDFSKKIINKEEEERIKQEELKKKNSEIYKRLYDEIEQYRNYRVITGRPMKILVTYDSYHIVVDILNRLGMYERFYTVIDEFQSILHDSRFKSSTELQFMDILRQSPSALFVSATPMMDEYLEMLSDFNNLPYYTFNWGILDPMRVIRPSLKILTMKSVGTKAQEILEPFLRGEYEKTVVMRDRIPVEIVCDEMVLYVNSVNHIISIIKKLNLTPDQVNIICSDTEENRRKIKRKLGKKFDIGDIPKRGEKSKIITICTRTAYLGADFYSYCAQTIIFSDSNIESLAVDISEDLPQILGRQRLDENPWKNSATFYYRTTCDYRKVSQDYFDDIINKKSKATESLLRAFDTVYDIDKEELAKNYEFVAKNANYKDNYVAVNKVRNEQGNVYLKPVMNDLVLVNELRAFKIQQYDYQDRFAVFTSIHNTLTPDDIINREVSEFMNIYFKKTTIFEKLKLLCEYGLSQNAINIFLSQLQDGDDVKSYYTVLGPDKLKALSYNTTKIKKALGIVTFSQDLLRQEIYSNFKEGEKYTLANLKNKLGSIYSSINYQSTPKANDIENWFEIKGIVVYEKDPDTGKRKQIRAYELLKSKRNLLEERLVD